MKTILSIFTIISLLGVFSTIANAGTISLPDTVSKGPITKTTATQQPRKHLQKPPANLQTPTRTEVRPVLKNSSTFKPLPNDDRKKINDSMAPVN